LVKFVWLANIKPKRIASASRGFLAVARLTFKIWLFEIWRKIWHHFIWQYVFA